MRTTAFSLFVVGALAAPSANKHHHRHRRQADNVAYTTCVETEYVTTWLGGNPTSSAAAGYAPQPSGNAPAQDGEALGNAPIHPIAASDAKAVQPSSAQASSAQAQVNQAPSSRSSVSADAATQVPAANSVYPDAAPLSTTPIPLSSFVPASSVNAAAADDVAYSAAASDASSSSIASAPASTSSESAPSGSLPFKNIVIFGDNLSDRGNGSSDHQVAGNPEDIYGNKTWTNGLIAAENLANNMSLDIVYDFAYGHATGGSLFGATVDNTFTQSMADAPSAADQIKNYTSGPYYDKGTVGDTLHFLWIGNNDVIPWNCTTSFHPDPAGGAEGRNAQFSSDLASLIAKQAQSLADAGAKHIFVPNVYNRHMAPVTHKYFSQDPTWIENYGQIIQNVNSNLETDLKGVAQKSGAKVTYYDAFNFLNTTLYDAKVDNANNINMTDPGNDICDHSTIDPMPGVQSLDYCFKDRHAYDYFWMQYLDPTAHVHALLSTDMQKAIQAAYA
ncbi:MAG: hypothetical protein Q9162_005014 [Coniocarpon cinnabarinum]